jgi:hypothetical protein
VRCSKQLRIEMATRVRSAAQLLGAMTGRWHVERSIKGTPSGSFTGVATLAALPRDGQGVAYAESGVTTVGDFSSESRQAYTYHAGRPDDGGGACEGGDCRSPPPESDGASSEADSCSSAHGAESATWLTVRFPDGKLFLTLPFRAAAGAAVDALLPGHRSGVAACDEHLCADDLYKATFVLAFRDAQRSPNPLSPRPIADDDAEPEVVAMAMTYVVKGPKKDYEASTTFKRLQ